MKNGGILYLGIIMIIALVVVLGSFGQTTKTTPIGPYPSVVDADDLDITFAVMHATETVWDATFIATGKELILFSHAAAATNDASFTIWSIADSLGRKGDIGAYQLSPGEYAAFWIGNQVGWRNASTGAVSIRTSTGALKWNIVQIPN